MAFQTAAWAVDIENIRIGEKKTFTRLVFDLDAAPNIYNVNYLSSPDRIVVDFSGSTINPRALKNSTGFPLIKNISQKKTNNTLSIEITLTTTSTFKHFILPPAKTAGYRLVLDITKGKATQPAVNTTENKSLTIIPSEKDKREIAVKKIRKDPAVTDYQSDAIDLYSKEPFSDAQIDQFFKPFQGNTQLKESYLPNIKDKTKLKKENIKRNTQKTHSNSPTFSIRGYQVKGNTLLSKEVLIDTLKEFTGQDKNFSDVQHALESLETRYQQAGFGMVQVYLPEQELTNGVIIFNIIEPKVKTLTVAGAEHFNVDNIQNGLVSLKEGVTPNTKNISKNLALLNENPAKKTTVQFLPAEEEGMLNTLVNISDKKPSSYALSFDNTGTDSTGKYRLGISYQHANLTNRDDVLNLNYTTSEKTSAISIAGFGYHLPFYQHNSSLDIFGGYSKVDSGIIQNLFTVAGKGIVLGGRYNQILEKQGNYAHRLIYGLDYRQYDTDAVLLSGGGSFIPDIKVHPVNLTYSGQWTSPGMATGFNLQWHYNVLTTSKDKTNFTSSRTGAKPGYTLYRFGIEHAQAVAKNWQLRIAFSGQHTTDALVSGEQFGIGGATSVRGYNERELSNDKGYQLISEIYSPDVGSTLGINGDTRFLAFYDMGNLSRNLTQPGDTSSASISSIGLGMRLNYKENLSIKLDLASALKATSSTRQGATKLHAALKYVF